MADYTIITRQTRGVLHQRRHQLCQDSMTVFPDQDALVLAVADGHGGSLYTRSGLGARIACKAVRLLATFQTKQQAVTEVKSCFDRLVEKHLAFRPLPDDQKKLLNGQPDSTVYGTTLVAAVIREEETILYQIGDGGVFLLNERGRFLPPLAADSDCIGSCTSSLVYTRERYLEHIRISHCAGRPAAIMLFTDGINFSSSTPWKAACLLRAPDKLETTVDQLLANSGHGDDQTFILAYDPDKVSSPAFLTGLDAEEQRGQREQKLSILQEQKKQLECWLQLALQKGRRMKYQPEKAAEFAQFCNLIKDRMLQRGTLLQEMEHLEQQLKSFAPTPPTET